MARSSLNLKILLFYLFNIFVSTLSPRISFLSASTMFSHLPSLHLFFFIFSFLLSQQCLIMFINTFIPKRLQLVKFSTFKSLFERKPLKKKRKKFTETPKNSNSNYCKINDNLSDYSKLIGYLVSQAIFVFSFSFHRHCPHPFFYRHPHPPCIHTRAHICIFSSPLSLPPSLSL